MHLLTTAVLIAIMDILYFAGMHTV